MGIRVMIRSLPYQGRYGFPYREHSIQDIDPDEAAELVKAGIAFFEDPRMTVETAMEQAAENMAGRTVSPAAATAVPVPEAPEEPAAEAEVADEPEADEEAPQGKKGKKKKSAEGE